MIATHFGRITQRFVYCLQKTKQIHKTINELFFVIVFVVVRSMCMFRCCWNKGKGKYFIYSFFGRVGCKELGQQEPHRVQCVTTTTTGVHGIIPGMKNNDNIYDPFMLINVHILCKA